MNYRKNPDNTYTAFQLMRFDNTMLEATAQDLENAQRLLKNEIDAYKMYTMEEVGSFFSPSKENQKGIIYAREKEKTDE